MPRDSKTTKQAGDTTAHNIHDGRDFTQINNSINHQPLTEPQSPKPETQQITSWLNVFAFLLKQPPITPDRLNTFFRATFLGSIAVLIGTLTAVIPNYTPVFTAGKPVAPSVFFPLLLAASLIAYASKEYFLTRESSTCPACETPFSLSTTTYSNHPPHATESIPHERLIECIHCEYELTDTVSWTPPSRPQPIDP